MTVFGVGLPAAGWADDAARLDRELPDYDWTALPPGARRRFFDAPSGRLAGVEMGDPAAPRVLLVPGATGSKEDFVLMLPLLASAGYLVQSYDLAGQYESAAAGPERLRPPRQRYDYDLFVNDLLAVLDAGSGPVHVLGYSFAGVVAQLAYARWPGAFASLALLSCPPTGGQTFRGIKRVGPLTGLGSNRFGASVMISGIRHNVTGVPPGRLRFVTGRFGLTRRESVDDIIGLLRDAPDPDAALHRDGLPTLVAVGEHDLWPLEAHRRLAEELGAELHVYPAGHSPCESSPFALSRDLLALYRRAEQLSRGALGDGTA